MTNGKEDVRVSKTKAAFRKAFLDLAAENKISEITITNIADKAGINRTTFYLHYKTIDDVYRDIINENTNACIEIINRHKEELSDFEFGDCAVEFVKFYDEFFGVKEVMVGTGFVACIKRKLKNILSENLIDLYKNTDMRDKYIMLSDEMISGLVYCFVAILSDWVSSGRNTPLNTLCREYHDVVLNGIKK